MLRSAGLVDVVDLEGDADVAAHQVFSLVVAGADALEAEVGVSRIEFRPAPVRIAEQQREIDRLGVETDGRLEISDEHADAVEARLHSSPPLMNVTNAIAGRFEESRMANCIMSKRQPSAVHSLRMRSSSWSVTSLVSTTLYCVGMDSPGDRPGQSRLAARSLAA